MDNAEAKKELYAMKCNGYNETNTLEMRKHNPLTAAEHHMDLGTLLGLGGKTQGGRTQVSIKYIWKNSIKCTPPPIINKGSI